MPKKTNDYPGILGALTLKNKIEIKIKFIKQINLNLDQFIQNLIIFPQRGTCRDDLSPGLRIIGFERRVAIVFKLVDDTILIVRVFYGGRDLAALLNENAALPGGESGAHDDGDFDEDD